MTISEKVAYIRGLMDGFSFDVNAKETKIIQAIVDVLEDLAVTVADIEDEVAVIDDDCSEIFDRLDDYEYNLSDIDEEENLCMFTCPECGNDVFLDTDKFFEGEAICPDCGSQLKITDFESHCNFDCENCDDCNDED